ncbi:GvpL/GvpF family gas vesicle protein [Streptomyces sp. NPDC086554]|uniref:GvpL/GvpF family gas vesicle protein n=1 Tax=Streptomyces sp. NPDC086554 TaxID=3154864 RepID=UPI00343B016F
MTGLRYVYAVCRPFGAALQADVTGVAGSPPGQLPHHGLIAVVSQVPERDFAEEPLRRHLEDLEWLSATARAHQGVIDALTAVTTPLPLRLATVFRDDAGVRVMMEAREQAFRRVLARLDGRVEWGVKVYAEPEAAESAESTGPPEKAATGRDYLRRRRLRTHAHDEMWQRAEKFARRLHDTLSASAEDARLHAPQAAALSRASGRNVLNAAYLVPRSRSEAFVELVGRTQDTQDEEAPGLRVELTGPWAAYSFAGLDGDTDDTDDTVGEARHDRRGTP